MKVLDEIVRSLEKGLPPWRQPWISASNFGIPANSATNNLYNGLNLFALQMSSLRLGVQSRWWATYKQWASLGCSVRRRPDDVPEGSWGTYVFQPNGSKHLVFNADQTFGLSAKNWKIAAPSVSIPDYSDVAAAFGVEATAEGCKKAFSEFVSGSTAVREIALHELAIAFRVPSVDHHFASDDEILAILKPNPKILVDWANEVSIQLGQKCLK